MPARNINSVHALPAGQPAAQHVTPPNSCPELNKGDRSGCPTPEHLWPIVVDETPAPWVARRVESCSECQRRMRGMIGEIEAARFVFSESQIPDDSADSLVVPKNTDDNKQCIREPMSTGVSFDDAPASKPADSLAMIGKYFVLERICDSGQATVYRGLHPSLLIEVVIKLAHVPWRNDEQGRARLVAEAKALADLGHPHLARLYDLDFVENRPFLVLEYVRGRHLRHYRESTALDPSQIARLIVKVARALAAAHERGILHLDLKPENILVTQHGEPVLIDFGLSFLSTSGDAEGRDSRYVAGTPQYMAPEQTRTDGASLTQRTDVYGLGGVLYYLCVGHDPFVVSRVDRRLQRSAEPDWRALARANVPIRLKQICRKALSTVPESRYSSAETLAEALEDAGRRWTEPALQRFRKIARWVLLAGIACLLAAIGFPEPAPLSQSKLMLRLVRSGRELPLSEAIPIRSDDHIRIEGTVHESSHVALFAVSGEQPPQWLAPLSLSEDRTGMRLAYPNFSETVPLNPDGETLLALLVTQQDAPIQREQVMRCLNSAERHPFPRLPAIVTFSGNTYQVQTTQGGRMTSASRAELTANIDSLRARLAAHFDDFAGVLVLTPDAAN